MKLSDAKQAKKGRLSRQPNGTKPKGGRPLNKAITAIMKRDNCSLRTAFRKQRKSLDRKRSERDKLIAETGQFCSIIKPTDNWNFDAKRMIYPRLDPDGTHGYIPGELYANCLFHFAPTGGLVVAPMAGSGMIHHVYQDRALWAKGRTTPMEIDLRMYDLTPRGGYASLIKQWDLADGFPPVERAPDYVVLDPPYLGMCRGQYSGLPGDLANMDEAAWTAAIYAIAQACGGAEARRCTVLVPASVDHVTWNTVHCPQIIREAWHAAGYRLLRTAYASKHTQQHGQAMARWNNIAREQRAPIADICEVQTFVRLRGP